MFSENSDRRVSPGTIYLLCSAGRSSCRNRVELSDKNMEIYFDESGDFQSAPIGNERFSFVMGLVIPEGSAPKLKTDFEWFESKLKVEECEKREGKGGLLSLEHRKLLLEILKAHPDVMLVPVTVNLGCVSPEFLRSAPSAIRGLIEKNIGQDSPHMTTSQRKDLARRISNLSAPVLARIAAYAIGVLKAVESITLYYHCEKFHDSYDPIRLVFDRVGRPGSREELVFRSALPGWISSWTSRFPIQTSPAYGPEHPIATLYGEERDGRPAIDLNRMAFRKIEFANSKEVWQIRLTDFLANTWSRVILDYDGTTGHQPLFRELNRKTALQQPHLLGVVGLTESTSVVPGPSWGNIFYRMVDGDKKILPCS
jgi:Protein of unknown function (DUF3800)